MTVPDTLDSERFPIGRFDGRPPADQRAREALVASIARTPGIIRGLVSDLSDAQLELRYRDAGWTIRQVVHHVPDSHLNAYTRTKLALTEDNPVIKPYEEARWAELPDVRIDVGVSLDLLDALHRRWVVLLRSLSERDCVRTFQHPQLGQMSIAVQIALYEWHGRHHTSHIEHALARGRH